MGKKMTSVKAASHSTVKLAKKDILQDYQIAFTSRQISLIGRKEVLAGRAKFGIFGDGKEVAQVALAHFFNKGDWRSGYYRDQTLMLALKLIDVKKYFAQLYADPNLEREPASGGRQMNAHFATRFLDKNGEWLNQCMMYNSSADISPTAGQMARLLGLGYASKLYRAIPELSNSQYSVGGNEVVFGTIGDSSTSEGVFWETINAAGVLQVPAVISVWDDGYGISVPQKYQTCKESISDLLSGFNPDERPGVTIHKVKGWDYEALIETYERAVKDARENHKPQLVHVVECTQPQGHSTSGSHERYKSDERLKFETEFDGLNKLKAWMVSSGVSTDAELENMEQKIVADVKAQQKQAWNDYLEPAAKDRDELVSIFDTMKAGAQDPQVLDDAIAELKKIPTIRRRDVHVSARRTLIRSGATDEATKKTLKEFESSYQTKNKTLFGSHLYSETGGSPLDAEIIALKYPAKDEFINGSEILAKNFAYHFKNDSRIFAIGEDLGKIGGVNQGMIGIQEEFGEARCTDTGIREATILGQGIGAAMRGLRPIVDIQYLDYMLYCFQTLSDDLATLHYRTVGGQASPVIIRTRGHRLEGIWHTGSPMGVLLGGSRGLHICVPRNMTQAAGMYNTLLKSNDPAIVIEVLNGYRVKERLPENIGEFCVPLGIPEILREGTDITLVSYGATVKICEEAAVLLESLGVSVELVDAQTLLPYDRNAIIVGSIRKTNAVAFCDEDVPGGASSYMMQATLDRDGGYEYLDAKPITITAAAHRSPYGSDGDYYSKPSAEDIAEKLYEVCRERDPERFAEL